VTFNVMSKLGPHHSVAKEWFELKGQVALERLRQESEQLKFNLKKAEAVAKSKDREACSLLNAATSQKLVSELSFDDSVSQSASSLTGRLRRRPKTKRTIQRSKQYRKTLLLGIEKHCCCISKGIVVAYQKALLLHIKRHCCHVLFF